MDEKLIEKLEDHVSLIIDDLEDPEKGFTVDERKVINDELRVSLQALTEYDKSITNACIETTKQKMPVSRMAFELVKATLPVVISGGIILTCHKWGYQFEESGLRRLSDVWRRMPNMKI